MRRGTIQGLSKMDDIYIQSYKHSSITVADFSAVYLIYIFPVLRNKLAKAQKMRKPPGKLGLKKLGPGKIWVEIF